MKKAKLFIFLFVAVVFSACENDLDVTHITYLKGEAIYADLSVIRNTPLKEPVKELINPGKVYVSSDLLLIGEEEKGIHVYDNMNPESPEQMYFINVPGNKEFYVHNNKIFAESLYDVVKIDISDRDRPYIEDRVENVFSTPPTNNNGEAIVGFEFNEVTEKVTTRHNDPQFRELGKNDPVYIDFNNRIIPRSDLPVSFAGSSGSAIATVNRIAYAKEHLYIIDRNSIYTIEDSDLFEFKDKSNVTWNMETIYPQDDALFIGTRNSMEILSIVNPSNPSRLGSFQHARACDPVLPNEDTAYVTIRGGTECGTTVNGLFVVDISILSAARELQNINMESPYGMSIINGQLYVGEGENGLKIFDIDPLGTLELVEHDKSIIAYDVIQHPTRADILLVANPDGFGQYLITVDNKKLLSWIAS